MNTFLEICTPSMSTSEWSDRREAANRKEAALVPATSIVAARNLFFFFSHLRSRGWRRKGIGPVHPQSSLVYATSALFPRSVVGHALEPGDRASSSPSRNTYVHAPCDELASVQLQSSNSGVWPRKSSGDLEAVN